MLKCLRIEWNYLRARWRVMKLAWVSPATLKAAQALAEKRHEGKAQTMDPGAR